MLQGLRREFVIVMMVLVGLVLLLAMGSTLLSSYHTQNTAIREALEQGMRSSIDTVPTFGEQSETSPGILTFSADVTDEGTVIRRSSYYIDSDVFSKIVDEALESDADSGKNVTYHLAWMKEKNDTGWRISIADTHSIDKALWRQTVTDAIAMVIAMVALFVITWLLATWMISPIRENWESQARFISDASHELKTPLAVIIADTDILLDDPAIPENSRNWVRSASEEAKHMKGLVEDLLTLARTDEATTEGDSSALTRTSFDLSELVEECILEFDAVAYERGCTIEKNLEQDIYYLGDREQIARAIRTLIDNATKYATKGTAVMVTLSHDGSHVKITVNNRGALINPADLPHLFDRFYRTDRARSREQSGGFGLGLAICKGIIEAHGGSIKATSTEAEGNTFIVTL